MHNRTKHFTQLMCLLALSFAAAAEQSTQQAELAFEELKSLVGLWKVDNSDSKFRIQFSTTANSTVLVESWLSKGKTHSLTLYHLNGETLMATHYCPQGNQPRLQMREYTPNKTIAFDFLDATNLKDVSSSHQHYLAFDFSSPKGLLRRSEAYRSGKKSKMDELVLVRVEK